MPFLPPEAFDFADRHFIDADLVQCICHSVQAGRFDDSFNFFHKLRVWVAGIYLLNMRSFLPAQMACYLVTQEIFMAMGLSAIFFTAQNEC